MKPIDRFGLDLSHLRFLTPSEYNRELFYLETTRTVRADNTFSFQSTRYEAPRDLRNLRITIRYDRLDPHVVPIVYQNNQRLGKATKLDLLANDGISRT